MDSLDTAPQQHEQCIADFIARWRPSGGAENANAQLFLTELCELIGVDKPDPARQEVNQNAYTFERDVFFQNPDGSNSSGRIDLYKRGCFVCESKQAVDSRKAGHERLIPAKGSRRKQGMAVRGAATWFSAMAEARGQAESYVKALPSEEGRPPFVMVIDVGYCIEVFAEFSRTGGTYIPFPDPNSYRIMLQDLEQEHVRERLKTIWQEPMSLDPSRRSARVTREIADRLARLARSLESSGHAPEDVAAFLMRCLFTMFAEDVELLPRDSFTRLLQEIHERPGDFAPLVESLWRDMKTGGFSGVLRQKVLHFNGALFEDVSGLELDQEQLELLLQAAQANWRDVEPAIFGTLLERALDPKERHKLGAHYTPRAYVERLVMPTVIEPLRAEWNAVKASALAMLNEGRDKQALDDVTAFHRRLCRTRVLDPACGSGNFLYVCLEHFKRLEGEVLDMEARLGQQQWRLEAEGIVVDPHQFLGLEVNPRAAAIADLVLWIGYLQWHLRTHGKTAHPPEPVIKKFRNIQCQDALITWERIEPVLDEQGQPVTRWDGETMKPHPATGELVPDESARVPVVSYKGPKSVTWPEADFVVGNPPFIGNKRRRIVLGSGYVDALKSTFPELPNSCDYVMFWWHKAAILCRNKSIRRFGFITTNSLRQVFNRCVMEPHLNSDPPLSLVFAIPDHPWVDASEGADVRIAMSVVSRGNLVGQLCYVTKESVESSNSYGIELDCAVGVVHSDLTVGVDVSSVVTLKSNSSVSSRGVTLVGTGFIVTTKDAVSLGLGSIDGLEQHIRPYLNGRDITAKPRGSMVIDLLGLTIDEVRSRFPSVYQWIRDRVKPERDQNRRESYRKYWWLFAEPRKELRPALADISRYIVTVQTSKHRFFIFLDRDVIPDCRLIAIASNDAFVLGLLSSRLHVDWALATGSRLGIGNDPVYNKSYCFETFPFPDTTEDQKARIRDLAEALDAHRKARLAEHPDLTMTKMYNVLAKLQAGEKLTTAERTIHEQGLVSVLQELHEDLDRAVLQAYGWPEDADTNTLLENLVALNKERAAEEARGHVRWLRPDYQNPDGEQEQVQTEIDTPAAVQAAAKQKRPWPRTGPEQAQAALEALRTLDTPATPDELAPVFSRANRARLKELLEAMAVLGQVRELEQGRFMAL